MSESETATKPRRLTSRGAATRARILEAAAELIRAKGVAATTLDEVRAASATSKSQLYHHFPDKEALVHEVISLQARAVLDHHGQQLQRLSSIRGLERWRDAVVQRTSLIRGAYGCALGSLVSELADTDEEARVLLQDNFMTWEGLLVDGFERMRASGELRPDADPVTLATGTMAALQGGYLLAQMARNGTPMEVALDMAIDHVKSYAA
ncbi:MAG TPA: TetR family transcriptional regulator [Conexibacter sp.]